MADNRASQYTYSYGNQPSIESLSAQVADIQKTLSGGSVKVGKSVPEKPTDIARYFIGEGFDARDQTKEALPDILQSITNQVARGQLTPEEARYSYLDLVKSTGSDLSKGLIEAEKLSNLSMGFAPAESYNRYKPAASLAFEQLLGRNIGDAEFQNYVSAAQGLGITKGPDFQAFLGETLLSSPEYKAQAVIFDPKKVASGINAVKSAPSLDEYAAMLGAVGG